jgi:rSAM/selenodomain-associated transferase 2/rSAM/selenodomain-associated transferase 1
MSPTLSAEEAHDLHERLTRHTLHSIRALVATGEAFAEVRTDAASTRAARGWLGARGVAYRPQGEGDLGDRIGLAFGDGFRHGAERVLVIGSDCPRLGAQHLRDALRRLTDADVVLGPACDGGYYLIGVRQDAAHRALPALFADVPWGTSEVLARTLELAENAGLSCALLEELPDVDRPSDLADAEDALACATVGADARVSVVIPALNDAALVRAAIASALAAGAAEVVVADGGSGDATRSVARAAGARVLDAPRGRAAQMNVGAAETTGDVLLFLHADTVLPAGACELVVAALARPGVVAGGFSYSVPSEGPHGALISALGRIRPRLGGPPWGDQTQFVSRRTFAEIGGFPELPVMEDFEFIHRLRRFGRVVTLPERAITSARTWDEHGLVFPTAVNAAVIGAYLLGVDRHRLARWRARITPSGRVRDSAPEGAPDVP